MSMQVLLSDIVQLEKRPPTTKGSSDTAKQTEEVRINDPKVQTFLK